MSMTDPLIERKKELAQIKDELFPALSRELTLIRSKCLEAQYNKGSQLREAVAACDRVLELLDLI